jgi:hypothetical protein
MIGGGVFALFALNMDTAVSSYGVGRINNLGLMADRQNYLIMSMGTVLVGVLLFLFGGKHSSNSPEPSTSQSDEMRACPFCAEPIKKEAIKCKHCGSEVKAEPEVLLGAFFEKPEDMSIGEYQEKFIERYKIAKWANGYIWRGENFISFAEVAYRIKMES